MVAVVESHFMSTGDYCFAYLQWPLGIEGYLIAIKAL